MNVEIQDTDELRAPSDRPEVLPGRTFWRGDAGYEQARLDSIWNGFKPDRYPVVIVQPRTAQDVARAVRYAARHGLKVKARSGGHSWTASFLRDDSMLVDLGAFKAIDIDLNNKTAFVGAAVHGGELQEALVPKNLFFPTGHCSDVAVGGYLLQGGWGWNVPKIGYANSLLESIELVTSTGEIINASANLNADFFWAARGAAGGFFGIVMRFRLKLLPKPEMRVSQSLYRREDLTTMLRWATGVAQYLPHEIEMNVFMMPDLDNMVPGGFALVNLACFAPTDEIAEQILKSVDTCPIRDRALVHVVAAPSSIAEMYRLLDKVYIKGLRFGADNMLSNAPPEAIIEAIEKMVENIPTPMSHVLWLPYPLERTLTDTSMAIMGTNYLVGYGACDDAVNDDAVQNWATNHMKLFEHLAVGMQLGDENLARRPHAVTTKPGAQERLEILRAKHDPNGVFHSYWLGKD